MPSTRERRFTTAIVLATLAVCAFFLAQGATRVLAARLFDQGATATEPPPTRGRFARPEFLRRRNPAMILERNIFDSSRGDLTLEPVEQVAEGPTGEWDPTQPAPECDNKLRLVGAVVNPVDPAWSYAAIAGDEGKTLLYRKGSNVDGSFVLAVRPSSVVVQPAGGGACEVAMFEEKEAEAKKPQAPRVAERTARRAFDRNGGLTNEEMDQGIQKISDTRFRIERSLVTKVLSNQGSLMKAARVIPHEENGRIVGVKLYGIRRSSLLGKLGIRNGDMLRTINGFDMASPDTALEAYARLQTADSLSLALKRQNKEMTIEYDVQ